MLHMFNNNIYTDFRTAYKHVLIPICYSSDLTEPKCCKNNYCYVKIYRILSHLKCCSFKSLKACILVVGCTTQNIVCGKSFPANIHQNLLVDGWINVPWTIQKQKSSLELSFGVLTTNCFLYARYLRHERVK